MLLQYRYAAFALAVTAYSNWLAARCNLLFRIKTTVDQVQSTTRHLLTNDHLY